MSREDIQKLLGGYATGTLTREEREALFTAALEDQELFNALAAEEPLRDLLQDPAAKARLRASLEVQPAAASWSLRWLPGMLRPALALASVAAMAVILALVLRHEPVPPRPVMIARAPIPPVPVASPLPQTLEKRDAPASRAVTKVRREPATPPAPAAAAALLKESTAPPPPPPPPAAPAAAEPPAAPIASARQEPPQPRALPVLGLRPAEAQRFTALAGAQAAGVGGALRVQDARALYYGAALPINVQNSLLSTGDTNRPVAPGLTAVEADAIAPLSTTHLGLRYTVLRRSPGGEPLEARAGEDFDPGDEVSVRFEANDAGSLSVFQRGADGDWHPLVDIPVARLTPHTVPLQWPASGPLELFVRLSRRPQRAEPPALTPPAEQSMGSSPAEKAAYVVSTSADFAAQKIGFPITLRRKSP